MKTKRITSLLLTVIIMLSVGSFVAPNKVLAATVNLAKDKTVTASSSGEGGIWALTHLIDGDRNAQYTSESSLSTNHTEWVKVDLGSLQVFGEVDLFPRSDAGAVGVCFPQNFTIEISTDDTNWTTVITQKDYPQPTTADAQRFTFNAMKARYVKVVATMLRTVGSEYRMQLAELEVYFSKNFSLGCTVTTSSNLDSSHTGANAVDGNNTTFWAASTGSFPQWMEIDLGAQYNLKQIRQTWADNDNSRYYFKIEGSNDHNTWTTLVDVTAGGLQAKMYPLGVNGSYRYVKMTVTNITNGHFATSEEFEVFCSADTVASNIAMSCTTSASSYADASHTGAQAVDGLTSTYWNASESTFPQWLKVDLGERYALNKIIQTFQDNDNSTFYYKIEGSNDDSTWTILVDRTSTGQTGQTFIETVTGSYRYVRITVTDVNNGHRATSQEFKVYGDLDRPTSSTFYVSSSSGNDSYDGKAASWDGTHGPWKTLTKASQMNYIAGDQLLLKCGDIFTDGLFSKGYGTAANPITISSYGTGNKPKIDREEKSADYNLLCISIDTCWGYEIKNIEMTGSASGFRGTVNELNKNYVLLENLYFHNISDGKAVYSDYDTIGYAATLGTNLYIPDSTDPILSDVTIRDCVFYNCHNGYNDGFSAFVGDTRYRAMRNLTVEGCRFEGLELWGFVTRAKGAIIKHCNFIGNNLQYCFAGATATATYTSEDVVWEYNEFSENIRVGTSPDGCALDMECADDNETIRYNSFHDTDAYAIMVANPGYTAYGKPYSTEISNNVFYNNALNYPGSFSYQIFLNNLDGSCTGTINDNIFYQKIGITDISPNPVFNLSNNSDRWINTETKGNNNSLSATATASSNNSTSGNVKDNNLSTTWTSSTSNNEWLQLEWASSTALNQFMVEQADSSSINNYVVQYWDTSANKWRDIFTSRKSMGTTKYMPTYPINTTKVRLYINSTSSGVAGIKEFRAFNTSNISNNIVSGSTYAITNQFSGKCLSLDGSNPYADGQNVYQWGWASSDLQLWKVEDAGNGYYKITNKYSNKCLSLDGSNPYADGQNVYQWGWASSDLQLWKIEDEGNGCYKITNKLSNKCLSLDGSNPYVDAQNVYQWGWASSGLQKWIFTQP